MMFDRIDEGRWWDFGWQLVEGCTKVSAGCEHCWSLTKEKRFRKESGVVFHPERLGRPQRRKKPAAFSVWNDLFHESVPFYQIDNVIDDVSRCNGSALGHEFQILTKRPERAAEFIQWHDKRLLTYNHQGRQLSIHPLPNLWLGVTAENQEMADNRIPTLLKIPATVRFVSLEPLLCGIDLERILTDEAPAIKTYINALFDGASYHEFPNGAISEIYGQHRPLNWVIVGCESLGGKAGRECKLEWVERIVDQCTAAGVPVFVKQLSINGKVSKNMAEWPEHLRRRQMPRKAGT